jgi:hypothetical protein
MVECVESRRIIAKHCNSRCGLTLSRIPVQKSHDMNVILDSCIYPAVVVLDVIV